MKSVTIIDYGIGNVFNVCKAFESIGAQVTLTSDPSQIKASDRVVLPGVGAFEQGMLHLQERKLVESVYDYVQTSRPILGICLGMQMLCESSEEFGFHKGLNLISEKVVQIPLYNTAGEKQKIPHIGWGKIQEVAQGWKGTILDDIPKNSYVYFVHSFGVLIESSKHHLASVTYGDSSLSAVIRKDQVVGCQFHPERSGPVGIKILENFLKI